MSSLFQELKRRNVFRVGVAYAVVGWLLVEVSSVVLPTFGTPEWVLKAFMFFVLLGFPVALIFAWAFEITPEGIKKEKDVDRSQSITHETGKKLNYWVVGAMALAIVYLVADKFVLREDGSESVADGELISIAVLPFVNMSDDEKNEYFSDGLSEELLNVLAKIKDFRVAGRTSSFAFKGKEDDLRVIGEKLNVETILEGSVRKVGDQVRVTAQLVNVDDGYHLWSESYDRQLDNIFEIQDEIAKAVVGALKQTLLGEEDLAVIERQSTANVESYNHYLRGNFHIRSRTKGDLEKAQQAFQLAVTLDPDFAEAWAGLADAYSQRAGYGFVNYEEIQPLAQAAIDRAMGLNDQLSEVWAAQSLVYGYGFRWGDAAEAAKRATELNPNNPIAWQRRGFNQPSDALDKAIEYLSMAHELDPLDAVIMANLSGRLQWAGQFERARQLAQETIDLDPDLYRGYETMAWVYDAEGRFDEKMPWLRKSLERDPESRTIWRAIGNTWLDFGELGRAQEALHRARAQNADDPRVGGDLAYIRFLNGDEEGALAAQDDILARVPDNIGALGDTAYLELMAGNETRARELLQKMMTPEPGAEAWRVTDVNIESAPYYSFVLYNADEKDRAREVSQAILARMDAAERGGWRDGWLHINRALARGAVGEREAAIAALRAAAETGWPGTIYLEHDPILNTLRDDLGYIALLDELRAKRREQLESLLAEGI